MLGAGSIDHRELIYYTVSKSTTFEPPRGGPRRLYALAFSTVKLYREATSIIFAEDHLATGLRLYTSTKHNVAKTQKPQTVSES